jgi:hypothetical protein
MIPKPVFIVLYNGEEAYPEQKTLRLTDAFKEAGKLLPAEWAEQSGLELEVTVYNVNRGQNAELVKRSRMLTGYVSFIGKYKEKIKDGIAPEDAIAEAVDECIDENILTEYLTKHGSEVRNMLITEWSNEKAMRVQRMEGVEEGEVKGEAKKQREIALAMIEDNEPIEKIMRYTKLPQAEIEAMQLMHKTRIAEGAIC